MQPEASTQKMNNHGKPVVYQGLIVTLWGQWGATSLNKEKKHVFPIQPIGLMALTIKLGVPFDFDDTFILFQLSFNFKRSVSHTFPQPFRCLIPHRALWWGTPSTAPCYIRLAHLGCCGVSVSEGRKNYFGTREWPKTLRLGWREPRC